MVLNNGLTITECLVGSGIVLSTFYGLGRLLKKMDESPRLQKMEIQSSLNFLARIQTSHKPVKVPFGEATYNVMVNQVTKYMEDNNIVAMTGYDLDGNEVTFTLAKLKPKTLPADQRVRDILDKMEYKDYQINTLFTNAKKCLGDNVINNYDELMYFCLKNLSRI